MKTLPLVTVALFNFNGYEDTQKCLKSLLKTTYEKMEIVVLDDGSKENEIGKLQEEFQQKDIHFFQDGKNVGFSKRANQVLTSAKGEYVVLLNNDTVVDKNWLTELVTIAESDDSIGVCQSKLLSMKYPEFFEYAGGCGGLVDALGYPYARGRLLFHLEQDKGQYDTVQDIFWACGAAMLIRKNVIEKAGLFDTDLFAYVEENDFCWRVKKAGYRIVAVPASVVYHKGTGYWSKKQSRKTFLIHRNNLMVLLEHVSFSKLLWIFPLRILLDYMSIVFYCLTDKTDYAGAVLKAHISLISFFPLICKKRKMIYWKKRRRETEKSMVPFSILWCYFVEGKKRYSDLFNLPTNPSNIPTMHYSEMLNISRLTDKSHRIKKLFNK